MRRGEEFRLPGLRRGFVGFMTRGVGAGQPAPRDEIVEVGLRGGALRGAVRPVARVAVDRVGVHMDEAAVWDDDFAAVHGEGLVAGAGLDLFRDGDDGGDEAELFVDDGAEGAREEAVAVGFVGPFCHGLGGGEEGVEVGVEASLA